MILGIVLVMKGHIGVVVLEPTASIEVFTIDAARIVPDEALSSGFGPRIEPFGVGVDSNLNPDVLI